MGVLDIFSFDKTSSLGVFCGLGLWYTLLPGVFYSFGKMDAVPRFHCMVFTSSSPQGVVFKGTSHKVDKK